MNTLGPTPDLVTYPSLDAAVNIAVPVLAIGAAIAVTWYGARAIVTGKGPFSKN